MIQIILITPIYILCKYIASIPLVKTKKYATASNDAVASLSGGGSNSAVDVLFVFKYSDISIERK